MEHRQIGPSRQTLVLREHNYRTWANSDRQNPEIRIPRQTQSALVSTFIRFGFFPRHKLDPPDRHLCSGEHSHRFGTNLGRHELDPPSRHLC